MTIMKMFLLASLFFALSDSGVYSITFDTVGNKKVDMSAFRGKRILITTLNTQTESLEQLQFLNTLQEQHIDSLVIIAVPSLDLDNNADQKKVLAIQNRVPVKFIITKPVSTKKGSGQHPLMKWITTVSDNQHFDVDVKEAGQFFVISKKGTLYAVLRNSVPATVLQKVLSQELNEMQ